MKNNELYEQMFKLLLTAHTTELESNHCHWNCTTDRSCEYCEHFIERKEEYWAKLAKKELGKNKNKSKQKIGICVNINSVG
jgi:hypothetical protein